MRPLLLALLISWPSPSWAPTIQWTYYAEVYDQHSEHSCKLMKEMNEALHVSGICKGP